MTDTITLPRDITEHIEMVEAICKEAHCCGGIAYDIWEAIVAAAPVNNGWIKCSDRLPEEGEAVIFVTKHWAMHVGTYHLTDDCDFSDGDITHWRPLPPLPTGPLDH